jgi:glycosyltransferase involved in cell wall biosynthesis
MRIFGNCLVKNEADMIEETLLKAARWCDRIYVLDNGSTDGTWEKVQALATREARIVAFQQLAVPFRNDLRRHVFEAFRAEARSGDWWCVLDADEIYIDNPREFLAAVPARHHVVWGAYFQHYFTDHDVEQHARDPQAYPPHGAAEDALQHWRCDYSEVRFYRHRAGLVWNHGSAPRHLGVVHPRRIRFKHYQYRSPAQITLRLATRQLAIKQGCENFADYSSEVDWRDKIVPADSCRTAQSERDYVIDEAALPRHVEPPLARLVKHALHGSGLWP